MKLNPPLLARLSEASLPLVPSTEVASAPRSSWLSVPLLQLLLDTPNRKPGTTFTSEPSRLHTCGGRGRVWAGG